jgi:predicted acylesterase/phospholipase RssA
MKNLVIGPGAMGFFLYLGVISKLKREGNLDDLEAISGASAGGLLGFLFCLTKGDPTKVLDYALKVPLKQIMKPNIKVLLKDYGLIPYLKIRKVLSDACRLFMDKDDVTFQELYDLHPIKLHVSAYCVDFMKTVYFSVDSTPSMSVLDAICATIAIPFLFSSVKLKDGWNYIDGGSAEVTPGAPFLGKNPDDVFSMKLAWSRLEKVKDLKTYAISILYSTMKLRHTYEWPVLDISVEGDDVYDFNASNDNKLKMFLKGYSQNFSQ